MKVELIGYTNPVDPSITINDVVYTAMSQCYEANASILNTKNTDIEKKTKIIKQVLKSGHSSVVEHISFTFLIKDVSLVAIQQLIRHRIASYTQRSMRYTKVSESDWYIVPNSICNKDTIDTYINAMNNAMNSYVDLLNAGIKKEDARYVLPVATGSNIVVTMNARALKNFFGERLCIRAQQEIRYLANEMANICKELCPIVFDNSNYGKPKCIQIGKCTEHKSCGYFNKYYSNKE